MESEGSLPWSQEPVTSTYPEPAEFSPQLPTLFLWDTFGIAYTCIQSQKVNNLPNVTDYVLFREPVRIFNCHASHEIKLTASEEHPFLLLHTHTNSYILYILPTIRDSVFTSMQLHSFSWDTYHLKMIINYSLASLRLNKGQSVIKRTFTLYIGVTHSNSVR
jgi:hypothetical protein